MSDKTEKKYMKKSEIVTFGIGLFGVALMTGWMPDYTATFFADFAFKGKGFDSATMANAISMVFLVAGIIGAVCELVNFVLKKFSTKKTFILFCVYGASSMAILFLVSKGIGFNSTLIVPFLILNFFCGLQHGNTNVTPNIMIADCVDEIEWKTGQRKDGLAYAGYGLFSKIASAFTKALGPWLLYTWSGYAVSRDANVAYAAQTDSTLNKILMIYTIIPAVFVVLQAVPIFFYDMVGEKKARITRELMERREAAGLVAGEGEETADAAAAE